MWVLLGNNQLTDFFSVCSRRAPKSPPLPTIGENGAGEWGVGQVGKAVKIFRKSFFLRMTMYNTTVCLHTDRARLLCEDKDYFLG